MKAVRSPRRSSRSNDRAPPAFPSSYSRNNYRSDVINGILKCVQCRIDLGGVEIDNAQCLCRKSKFAAAREFDECWKFSREMIGDADDLHFFVDQLRVRKNRYRFSG